MRNVRTSHHAPRPVLLCYCKKINKKAGLKVQAYLSFQLLKRLRQEDHKFGLAWATRVSSMTNLAKQKVKKSWE